MFFGGDKGVMSMMHSWTEQWARVLRWSDRIQNQDRHRQDYEDYLWAFFQNCWHMKDWLKNDPALGLDAQSVEDEVKRWTSLQICADLANRTKHLALTSSRKNADTSGRSLHAHLHTHIKGQNQRTRQKVRWDYRVISDEPEEKKALSLASEAIADWKRVFRKLGVKNPADDERGDDIV